jgi:hypothetical protein
VHIILPWSTQTYTKHAILRLGLEESNQSLIFVEMKISTLELQRVGVSREPPCLFLEFNSTSPIMLIGDKNIAGTANFPQLRCKHIKRIHIKKIPTKKVPTTIFFLNSSYSFI